MTIKTIGTFCREGVFGRRLLFSPRIRYASGNLIHLHDRDHLLRLFR